ncbi:MAG: EAL domain-containing protein [Gammaproteobacteria bacterium]|nr:EAL domain-containing protein [Gammaproteobacteria bacterium]
MSKQGRRAAPRAGDRAAWRRVAPSGQAMVAAALCSAVARADALVAEAAVVPWPGDWQWLAGVLGASLAAVLLLWRRAVHRLRLSDRRFDSMIDFSPDAMLCVDGAGRIVRVNERCASLSGYPASALLGQRVECLVPKRFANHADAVRGYLARPQVRMMGSGRELALQHRDGHEIPVEIGLTHLPGADGALVVAAVRDLSERKRAEVAIARSERRLREITNNVPGAVFQAERAPRGGCVFRFVSDGIYALLDITRPGRGAITPDELLARVAHEDRPALLESLEQASGARSSWAHEFRVRTGQGSYKWVAGRAEPAAGAGGALSWNGVLHDVTEMRQLSEELSHLAAHDGLTGLVNRRAFEHALVQVLARGRESGQGVVLACLDLDQFKVVNDTCGHAAGDELLRQVTALLGRHLRGRDVLGRLGGDEFAIVMEGAEVDVALNVMERIREVVANHRFAWEGKTFSLSVSIGVVAVGDGMGDAAEVMKCADAACYAAKDGGRNRIHLYAQEDAVVALQRGQMRWVPLIDQALAEGRFELYGQRIARLSEHVAEGDHVEILLRMRLDSGELATPGAFLPAAERYNLAPRVDRWVVGRALDHIEQVCAQHPDRVWNINLSGLTLGDPSASRAIGERLAASPCAARICLEITETALISNLSLATEFIARLKALGCRFALDDFGSGISSFGQLKNLDIDFVKIDGVFVRDMAADRVDREMVRAINDMAHVMAIKTVAECVEDEATLRVLRSIGVDFVQGFGIGRPAPLVADTPGPGVHVRAGGSRRGGRRVREVAVPCEACAE